MDAITQFDGNLLIGIQQALNTEWLTPVMRAITYLNEAGIFWIAICMLLVAFRKTRRLGIICAASLLLTFICCNGILKPLVDRARPWEFFSGVNMLMPDPGDASFPSGHTANAMGPAWAMFAATMPVKAGSVRSYDYVPCLGWKGDGAEPQTMHILSVCAVILAVLIGLSRLYLGMHFPTDVLAGLLLGTLCATLVCFVIRKIEKDKGLIGSGAKSNT